MSENKQGFWMVEVYTKAGCSIRIPIEGKEGSWIDDDGDIFLLAETVLNGRGINMNGEDIDYIAHRWIADTFDDYLANLGYESKEDFA